MVQRCKYMNGYRPDRTPLSSEGRLKKFLDRWKPRDGGALDSIGKASVIGLHLVSGIIVGAVIGYFLDKWLGTGPWLKIVFFIIGVAAGFLNVYRDTVRLLQMQDKQNARKPDQKD